jgi:hypothetical protein
LDAGAVVVAAVFLAVVFVFSVPLPGVVVDEAAPEDLDFAGEVFLVVVAVRVFLVVDDFALVVVDFALVVVDFALVAVDFDLAAALLFFGAAEVVFL